MKKEIIKSAQAVVNFDLENEVGVPPLDRDTFEALLDRVYEAGRNARDREDENRDLYFQQLIEMLPDYVYFKDLESRFLVVNPAHARFLGLRAPEDAVGKTDFDFFREDFARAKFDDEQHIIQTGEGFLFREEHHIHHTGEEQWALSTKLPLRDESGAICGTFGLSRDITDKKLSELELERQKTLLETIVEILPCRVFVRDLEGRYMLINKEYRKWIHVDEDTEVEGKRIQDFLNDEKVERVDHEDREIMRTGKPIMNQVHYDESPLQRGRWILTSKVPLRNFSNTIEGMVGMTLDITEQKEAEERARVAQTALLQKNQQMETELQVARQLQERLLSEGFEMDNSLHRTGPHWNLHAHYLYQPSHHLAGDFFFVLPLGAEYVGVIICDVMGHGVKAALVTTLIRGLLLEIPGSLENPSAVLTFLNRKLCGLARNSDFPRFVTASYGVFDMSEGKVTLASAGHPAPLWQFGLNGMRKTEVLPLKSMGSALGLQESSEYPSSEFHLESRTNFFFYTDGITELENRAGDEFGVERLISGLQHLPGDGPADASEAISAAITYYSEGREFDDDICMVSLEVTPHDID